MDIKSTIGARIKGLREEYGLSLYELADAVNRDPDRIVKMQRGESVTLQNMFVLSRYFGVSLDYLYGLSEEKGVCM